jgi:hypothetical protein
MLRKIENDPKVKVKKFSYLRNQSGSDEMVVINQEFTYSQVSGLVKSSILKYINYDVTKLDSQ